MPRIKSKFTTLRALLVKSGNICAFPGCNQPIVDADHNFVAQVCHIEAAEVGGERYNYESNDDYRRSFNNLILLCYRHHVETNDIIKFPTEKMKEIKLLHEKSFTAKPFKIDESHMYKLISEMEHFWQRVSDSQKTAQESHEYPVEISTQNSFFEILDKIKDEVKWIMETFDEIDKSFERLPTDLKSLFDNVGLDFDKVHSIPYYEKKFESRMWETRNIGFPNVKTNLNTFVSQIEIKFLEEYIKTNPNDLVQIARLEVAKKEFLDLVLTSGYVD